MAQQRSGGGKKGSLLKKILIAGGVIGVVFIGVVAAQPSEFKVTRSATIAAPPAVVFAQVSDFHKWQNWSPWAKLDPNAKATFRADEAGKNISFHWAGNNEVGEGTMTLLERRPHDLVRIDLEFIKPFAARNLTEFTLQPDANGTKVTWTMSGHNNFMGRAFCLVMNMDKMVGGDFEKGLASMKTIAEADTKK